MTEGPESFGPRSAGDRLEASAALSHGVAWLAFGLVPSVLAQVADSLAPGVGLPVYWLLSFPSGAALILHLDGPRQKATINAFVAWNRGVVAIISAYGSLLTYWVTVLVGLLLGVVPGLVFWARWMLIWPVAILEGRGLDRAAALSTGRRWPLLAGGLCAVGLVCLVQVAATWLEQWGPPWLALWLLSMVDLLYYAFLYAMWRRAVQEEG